MKTYFMNMENPRNKMDLFAFTHMDEEPDVYNDKVQLYVDPTIEPRPSKQDVCTRTTLIFGTIILGLIGLSWFANLEHFPHQGFEWDKAIAAIFFMVGIVYTVRKLAKLPT